MEENLQEKTENGSNSEKKDVLILAIESSCDETAAAVVKNGRTVLSNIISSQIDLHTLYGGVVPEIASRKHMEQVNQVTQQALKEAGVALDEHLGGGGGIGLAHAGTADHHLLACQRALVVLHAAVGFHGDVFQAGTQLIDFIGHCAHNTKNHRTLLTR